MHTRYIGRIRVALPRGNENFLFRYQRSSADQFRKKEEEEEEEEEGKKNKYDVTTRCAGRRARKKKIGISSPKLTRDGLPRIRYVR